jgi:hypothetical protein
MNNRFLKFDLATLNLHDFVAFDFPSWLKHTTMKNEVTFEQLWELQFFLQQPILVQKKVIIGVTSRF